MKALILAAGFGTRLLPFSAHRPKPLFPIAGRPLLDITIHALHQAGCQAIIINTHHLHQQIDDFIASHKYPIPVLTCHEPVILGTGGAIKNVAPFWDDSPFMVVNSDIITDIDLKNVYEFHLNHSHPITLVLHDEPEFNTVLIDEKGFIKSFIEPSTTAAPSDKPAFISKTLRLDEKKKDQQACGSGVRTLAFTGIHVVNPEILDLIPDKGFSSIIDIYTQLISSNGTVCAFISTNSYWKDIGTPQRYREAAFEKMASKAFQQAFDEPVSGNICCREIKGDGSDRNWYRLTYKNRSLVMVDHGIRPKSKTSEADAFVLIGRHLYGKDLPVPRIYLADQFAGLVFLQDLGDTSLQDLIQNTENPQRIVSSYQGVIDLVLKQSVDGAQGFDPAWTYQTESYSRDLILEKECRYFVEAFLNNYRGMDFCFENLKNDFEYLADKALEFAVSGFMHRDLQSRNIMVCNHQSYFIDFQGGRSGPIQYDLASLLIDPYTDLAYPLQKQLYDYSVKKLATMIHFDPKRFRTGYKFCAVTRNLQILGAFGYLSRTKGKTYFEKYIPAAVRSLKHHLAAFKNSELLDLKAVAAKL